MIRKDLHIPRARLNPHVSPMLHFCGDFALGKAVSEPTFVYAQRFHVEVIIAGERRPCPLDWLDSFCMRNFTGSAQFDDTLPLSDGLLEAGFRVAPDRLASALAEWLTRRGKGGGQPVEVEITPGA